MSNASPVRAEAERLGIVKKDCPDCQGNTFVILVGEEWPCPTCCPVMYDEQLRQRGFDHSQFGVGA